jgi:non-ribosomal peptide synthetase component F
VWQESIWSDQDYRDVFREVGAAEFLEFALLLDFEPREDGIRAKATYQQSVLSREQADILLEQIDVVASVLIDAPTLPIGDLGSHLPQHTLSVVNANCQIQGDLPRLASAVETIASAEPSRTAVECLRELDSVVDTITYGQLDSRATTLANFLLQMGVTRDDSIAMFLESTIDSYIAVLAIAKIGAGIVPFSEDGSSVISTSNVHIFMVHSYFKRPDALNIPESVRQITVPDTFNDVHNDTPFAVDDGFRIICTDPTSKEPITFSSRNLKSCTKVLTESYNVQSGSKMLFASPSTSVGKFHVCLVICIIL